MLPAIFGLVCGFAALLGLLAWTADWATPVDLNLLLVLVAVGLIAQAAALLQCARDRRVP